MERSDRPAGLILTRQDVPIFPRGDSGFADTSLVKRGGYVLIDPDGTPDVILIATGSEVQIAVAARERLIAQGVSARVVSMPCLEWFFEQDPAYRDSVLPRAVKARVSIEAGISQGWHRIVGDHGRSVSLEHFGCTTNLGSLPKPQPPRLWRVSRKSAARPDQTSGQHKRRGHHDRSPEGSLCCRGFDLAR